MDDLPTFVVDEILFGLPIMELMRCRSVCKSWLNIIDDPCFRESLPLSGGGGSVVYGFTNGDKEMGPIIYRVAREGGQMKEKQMASFPDLRWFRINELCSCNGFFVFERRIGKMPHIFGSAVVNPCTREVVRVPKSPYESMLLYNVQALGFEPRTNTYKLVQVMGKKPVDGSIQVVVEAAVYDFKSKSWRPCEGPDQFVGGRAVCFDGSLNWLSVGDQLESLVSFDLRSEKFAIIPIPMRLDNLMDTVDLDEVDGSLALLALTHNDSIVEIWVSGEGNSSWHQKWRIQVLYPYEDVCNPRILNIFCLHHHGKLLMRSMSGRSFREDYFGQYDLKGNQFEFWVRDATTLGVCSGVLNLSRLRQ